MVNAVLKEHSGLTPHTGENPQGKGPSWGQARPSCKASTAGEAGKSTREAASGTWHFPGDGKLPDQVVLPVIVLNPWVPGAII